MLRFLTAPLCFCQRAQRLSSMACSSFNQTENMFAVDALYNLSVNISKIRKLKSWVLYQSPVYVTETVALLKNLGASEKLIARVLEIHPEAILCTPEQLEAQKALWMSVCASQKDLVKLIENFPSSYFTTHHHIDNRRANIAFFQSLGLNKWVTAKLMASAPQTFSRPLEQNREVVQGLQKTYLELGGNEINLKAWLLKLLSQNPYVLQRSPESMRNNMKFLKEQGFTSTELLQLLSKLKGLVSEVCPESMGLALSFSQKLLGCSETKLREIVLKCPTLLYYTVPILSDRFKCLANAGISLQRIIQTPTVLELPTQIVQYRIQKLRSYGYDIQTGNLELLNGTKKDFETNCGKFSLRRERPLFNPVAPLRTDDE